MTQGNIPTNESGDNGKAQEGINAVELTQNTGNTVSELLRAIKNKDPQTLVGTVENGGYRAAYCIEIEKGGANPAYEGRSCSVRLYDVSAYLQFHINDLRRLNEAREVYFDFSELQLTERVRFKYNKPTTDLTMHIHHEYAREKEDEYSGPRGWIFFVSWNLNDHIWKLLIPPKTSSEIRTGLLWTSVERAYNLAQLAMEKIGKVYK